MKPFLLILLLLPIYSFAQLKDTVAPKKANRIVVVTNRPAKENFELLRTTLLNSAYTIRMQNSDSLTVHTEEKLGDSYTVSYTISGWAKENEIVLRGKYSSKVDASISGTNYRVFVYEIANTGKRGSVPQQTFAVLQELARKLNGEVFYEVQTTRRGSIF